MLVCDDTHTIRPTSLHERFKYPRVVDRGDGIDSVDEILGADKKFMPVMASAEPLVHVAGAPVDVDETMREYQRGIRRLALSLLRAMAEKLGLSRRHFDSGWAGSNSGVTSLHYLALESADAVPQSDGYSGQNQYVKSTVNGDDPVLKAKDSIGDLGASLRAYAHADGDTMLTLLCHDQVEGLQVLHRGETVAQDLWLDVPRISQDQIVVQIGQMTQRFTNDEYYATTHRVLKPEAPCPSRTTISCFFRPSQRTMLEVPPCLRRPNDLGTVYPPVTVEDFLALPRTDEDGQPVKLTSNILRNEKWVGAREGSIVVCNAI